jgi:hypothetical protein
MKAFFAGLLLAAYLALLADASIGIRPTPQCAEDVVLQGTGEFVNGRWSSFECGPARDDFTN